MAQQPAKLTWKEKTPFGLSASQFGMALGFLGKVSDYVDYQRNIVGTEQEFKGNAATAHGINTEAKARALYEMLTGIQVYDGGFFLSDERMLGCSPDGRSFFYDPVGGVNGRVGNGDMISSSSRGTATATTTALPEKRCFSENDAGLFRTGGDGDGAASPPTLPTSRSLLGSPASTQTSEASSRLSSSPKMRTTCAVKIPFRSKRNRGSTELPDRRSATEPALPTVTTGPLCTPTPSRHHGDPAAGRGGAADGAPPALPHSQVSGTSAPLRVPRTSAFAPVPQGPRFPKRRLRLLEIKSPFRALYDCRKELNRPFGIPQQYMCQMQGQMAIAGADECDFFIYLDAPLCQVEAWRVYRSPAFWAWAHPKLLQVVRWVRDGLPRGIDRSFSFDAFDFHTLTVLPLIHPFCITMGSPLEDITRFTYFHRFASPYCGSGTEAAAEEEAAHNTRNEKPAGLMDRATVDAVRSEVVKFLFDENEAPDSADAVPSDVTGWLQSPSSGEMAALGQRDETRDTVPRTGVFRISPARAAASFCEDLIYSVIYKGRWGQALQEEEGGEALSQCDDEDSNSSGVGLGMGRERLINPRSILDATIQVTTPTDWESGEVEVVFTVPCAAAGDRHARKRLPVRLFHRDFFNLLTPCTAVIEKGGSEDGEVGTREDDGVGGAASHHAESVAVTPRRSRSASVSRVVYIDVTPPAHAQGRRPKVGDDAPVSAPQHGSPPPPLHDATEFVSGDGTTLITVLTPARHDKSEPLSQQVRESLLPPTPQPQLSPSAEHAGDDAPTHPPPPPPLVREVDMEDVFLLLTDGEDCMKVVLVEGIDKPVRTFWRDPSLLGCPSGNAVVDEGHTLPPAASESTYELIVGCGPVLDAMAQSVDGGKGSAAAHSRSDWHRSVSSLCTRLGEGSEECRFVFCSIEGSTRAAVVEGGEDHVAPPRRAFRAPCFILRTQDSAAVFRRVVEQLRCWGI